MKKSAFRRSTVAARLRRCRRVCVYDVCVSALGQVKVNVPVQHAGQPYKASQTHTTPTIKTNRDNRPTDLRQHSLGCVLVGVRVRILFEIRSCIIHKHPNDSFNYGGWMVGLVGAAVGSTRPNNTLFCHSKAQRKKTPSRAELLLDRHVLRHIHTSALTNVRLA